MMISKNGVCLSVQTLQTVLPMHMAVDPDGTVHSIGPLLAKFTPAAGHISRMVSNARPTRNQDIMADIRRAADKGDRLFLRPVGGNLTLRGHAANVANGSILVNLGFGLGLRDAVRQGQLTDGDFAPSDLAMEFLFLFEANRAALAELSNFTSQLERARAAALDEALTDPLTGLTNRRGLENALNMALHASNSHEAVPFALAHLDLDNFKAVNDTLGHAAGDDMLRQVAEVLQGAVRGADTAARIGGDEFVLILRDMDTPHELDRLTQRIISAINNRAAANMGYPPVSASIGVVLSCGYGPDAAECMLSDADDALYQAKRAGRSRAVIVPPKHG
ncbi:GGDEF domain-containing protein [Paracoccus sp. (in: a-proteobacteria)]|uniref:GGDEF domain-containing protein n=1 Tax=Paracoccus sp. TaxID=267 RepID=UPI0026E04024|nr:GGDEF domain-containing protein [Paracoccus sp. (in: a-proteobacteria)]MDO5646374.1 GGDEF domain-containing protein [Paracoccus sp. (in: a-proteobacteria)]